MLLIHSLKLRHWKSHESSRFEFSKGTNLIIGPMGSGKSSLLDAICFALFGTFPALKSRRVSLEQTLMARPEAKTDASVEITFEAGGQKYTVTRTISGKGSEAYLRKGEQVIEGPQAQRTNEAVQNILKMDYELFTRAVYAEQNKVDHFLTLAPRERKKQIDELLGLDAFEVARATGVQALNKLKAQQGEAENILKSLKYEELRQLVQGLSKELQQLKAEQSKAEKSLLQGKKELHESKSSREQLEKLEGDYREAERRATTLEAQLRESSGEAERERTGLAELPSEGEALKEREKLERETRELEKTLHKARERALAREKLAGRLEALTQERKGKAAGLDGKLFEDEAGVLQKLEEERAGAEEKLEQTRGKLETNQALLAKAQAKGNELAERARERASIGEQLKELEQKHGSNLKERLAKAGERARELESSTAQAQARAEEAQLAHETLAKAGAGCPVCDAPLNEERRNDLAGQKRARQQESLEKRKTLEAQLRTTLSEQEELQKAVKKLELSEERLKSLGSAEELLKNARQEERKHSNEVEELRQQVNALGENVKGAAEREKKQEQVVRQLGELAGVLAQEAKVRQELEQMEGKEEKAEELEGSLKKAQERLNLLQRVARVHELQKRAASLEAEWGKTRKELAQLGFEPNKLAKAREKEGSLQQRLAQEQVKVESLRELEKEKSARLEETRQRASEGVAIEERLAALRKQEEELTIFGKALVETQKALREELIEGINEAMALLWKGLYPYRDYTAVRLSGGEEDYGVELRSLEDTWVPVEQASGGERNCAALSLRIAFATVLAPQLSWLVLDEPTHNLDTNAVLLLAHALRDEIPRIVDQVFIITHDEALKESASARVYRIERDKDKGDKSVVEEVALTAN